jgi:glycyl-tRNA synthetase
MSEDAFKKLIAHCKEYGYIFPSSEIYEGGIGAVYDYGPMGAELKNNIKAYWWKAMVQMNENIVGLDTAIFMHPTVWKASGHVDAFNDPLIDNKQSNKRYRADVLIEDKAAQYEKKGKTEKAEKLLADMNAFLKADDLKGLKDLIDEHEIADPDTGTKEWTDIRKFNLMFDTKMGAVAEDANTVYLRPETAQGIFVNFLSVQKTARQRLPFGIAQIGKAFRNEIVARQFIFRMREFEQMEMQFFVRPGEEMKWYEHWKETRMKWHNGLHPEDKLRWHEHENLAHYANAAVDIEFEFPFGFKELEGIHSRTDFDLKQHQEFSGKKMQYFDPEVNENYVPYVVETSIGLDRMFLATMTYALQDEEVTDAEGNTQSRVVLKLPPALAPIKVAVLPLTKKDGLPDKAREIMDKLKLHFNCYYEEKDSIGKRYRRQDAIGTPYCITIDHDSLEDNTVTIRERDTMSQDRVNVDELVNIVHKRVDMNELLMKL